MQQILTYLGTILSIFSLIAGCSTKGLQDYQSKSPDEKAIISVLSKVEQTWNNKDIEGHINLYHDDAKIMYGGGAMHTKADFKSNIPGSMKRNRKIQILEPVSIEISGDTARVKIWTIFYRGAKGYRIFETYDFVKKNSQWLIIRSIYSR